MYGALRRRLTFAESGRLATPHVRRTFTLIAVCRHLTSIMIREPLIFIIVIGYHLCVSKRIHHSSAYLVLLLSAEHTIIIVIFFAHEYENTNKNQDTEH